MLISQLKNRRLAVAAATVAAVPAALLVQPASTADTTLRLVERPATFRYVDLPPKSTSPTSPPSVGDEHILTARLFRAGKRVGTLHAVCVATRHARTVGRTPMLCSGTLRLGGSSIVGTALVANGARRHRIAITGGTGRYAGATGTGVEVMRENGRVVLTLHLA